MLTRHREAAHSANQGTVKSLSHQRYQSGLCRFPQNSGAHDMACFKLSPTSPFGSARLSGSYTTEAECNQACREGACCEGTSCSVQPQCQCQGAGKTFKGVGTACTGKCDQCLGSASNCFCYCTSQGGKVPRFINARIQFSATGPTGSGCDLSVDQNVTLTFSSANYRDSVSNDTSQFCYYWIFSSSSLTVTAQSALTSQGKEYISLTANREFCNFIGNWGHTLQSFVDKTTDSSGLCYLRHVGATVLSTEPVSGLASGTITILGFQE